MRTGEVLEYELSEGLVGQESWFVAEPWSTGEDEGVVMMQGLDAKKEKGGWPLTIDQESTDQEWMICLLCYSIV